MTEDELVEKLTDWVAERPRTGTELHFRLQNRTRALSAWRWLVETGCVARTVTYTGHHPRTTWALT